MLQIKNVHHPIRTLSLSLSADSTPATGYLCAAGILYVLFFYITRVKLLDSVYERIYLPHVF